MRIGIDGRALQGTPLGGVGQYALALLKALFTLDSANEYVVWYNAARELVAPAFSEYPNVRVCRTHLPNKLLNVAIKLARYPKFPIPIDTLFMPNLNFISVASGIKLILVIHDLSFEHFPEHFSLKSRLWHRAIGPRELLKRADHVIAVSEHTKGDLVETYGIEPEKVTVVYPGMDQRLASSVERLDPSPYTLVSTPYILYFGALEPRKNIAGIIAAYETLRPRQNLVIAGLATSYSKELKKRIAKSKLREKIRLIENPDEEEKAVLYAGAYLFVYPSYYEGFGFPPLEAMAAGVPVVASSASSVPEICGDGAVLVSPWKGEEIKEGMRILLEDDAVRTRYIAAGYERVKQFSWQRSAAQVLEILKGV